jgi:hypothetical protein
MTNESNEGEVTVAVGEEGRVLTSGVDSLEMTVDVFWRDDKFFKKLSQLKADAQKQKADMPGYLSGEGFEWSFLVSQFSGKGYEWTLSSAEYHVQIGNWMSPKSRPSMNIKIYSQTLLLYGVIEAIDRILALFACAGARATEAKLSRVDMCVDLLIPQTLWTSDLIEHRVTRARKLESYGPASNASGYMIGKGSALSARLYDKPREILEKSKKTWMYDLWQIQSVPEHCLVIRVEFQLRREAIKELGMNTVWSFVNHPRNAWGYCTQVWLRFAIDTSVHHRDQQTMPFWKTVQNGFLGGQDEHPMLRAKMVDVKRKQLAQQLIGQLTSLIVINSHQRNPLVRLEDHLPVVTQCAKLLDLSDDELTAKVGRKQGRYLKAVEKFKEIEEAREQLGLPTRKPQEGGAA